MTKRIVLEVEGGTLEITEAPKDLKIIHIDWDTLGGGRDGHLEVLEYITQKLDIKELKEVIDYAYAQLKVGE